MTAAVVLREAHTRSPAPAPPLCVPITAVAPSVTPTSGNAPLLVDIGANAYGSNKKQARLSVTFDGVTTPDCTLPVAYALADEKPFVALDANAQVRHPRPSTAMHHGSHAHPST